MDIIPLEKVNGVAFGSSKEEVRAVFGSHFYNSAERVKKTVDAIYGYMQNRLDSSDLSMISEFELDVDTYLDAQIEYRKERFVCATFYTADYKYLMVGGKKVPIRKIKKILELSDDFEWNEGTFIWSSKEKQIKVNCQDSKRNVISITFGCAGYF